MCSSSQCLICDNSVEDHTHLFLQCCFGKQYLDLVKLWLGMRTDVHGLLRLIRWINYSKKSKFKRVVWTAGVVVVVYVVWKSRNDAFWNQKNQNLQHLIKTTLGEKNEGLRWKSCGILQNATLLPCRAVVLNKSSPSYM